MKLIKKLILICIVILSLCLIKCQGSDKINVDHNDKFDAFTDDLFLSEVQRNTITLNYSLNNWEAYGIKVDEVTIGHFSPSYLKSLLSSYENYLAGLNSFNYNELSESRQLTYDVLEQYFELELAQEDLILYQDVLAPTTGMQAQLPVLLAEFNINTKEDIEIYLALIDSIYGYFEEICEFQRTKSEAGLFMNEKSADSIISQCENFIKDPDNNFLIPTINEKILNINTLTQEEQTNYQKLNREKIISSLVPAYELLINTLTGLKSSGKNDKGLYYYENGKEFYEYLVTYNTNSSKSVPELIEMVDNSIDENIAKMGTILSEDPSVYESITTLSFPLTNPDEIITFLEQSIAKDFPEVPSVNCTVRYVPESLEEHLSPAMYLVPAIDDYENNVIYINQEYDMANIFPTMAHEGYPGHLYQSVYFRDSNPTPIRSLLDFGGYVEGWATYVEYYSYHLAGFDENIAEFIIANMATNIGVYCMLDLNIHYEGWTLADTYNYLDELGIKDKELATILYETIVEEPGIYPQYGIGYLEILELKDKAQSKLGDDFVLKDFHTFMLDTGPAPFPIIEKRLEQEIKDTLAKAS